MYTVRGNVYSDAGNLLVCNNKVGFFFKDSGVQFTERKIDLSGMSVEDSLISFDIFNWANPGIRSYADAKKFVIGKRYSNDDQIAIILNKDNSDEDNLVYQKMQEWRSWASEVAHRIMEELSK